MTNNHSLPEYFADTNINISFTSGLVRIEFGSLQPNKDFTDSQPQLVPCNRLVLPLNGFLKMVKDCNGMIEKLQAGGVLGTNKSTDNTSDTDDQHAATPNPFKLDSSAFPAPIRGKK
ncbi:MAG: hypothetical protein ORN57_00380 [Alphaproteobacteria bacterium]|nr:hypothetical protein [Alphaproteobacteria bacterium]